MYSTPTGEQERTNSKGTNYVFVIARRTERQLSTTAIVCVMNRMENRIRRTIIWNSSYIASKSTADDCGTLNTVVSRTHNLTRIMDGCTRRVL